MSACMLQLNLVVNEVSDLGMFNTSELVPRCSNEYYSGMFVESFATATNSS